MGLHIGFNKCLLQQSNPQAIAPNPDPSKWDMMKVQQFDNAYVLMVKYKGCTNFEGIKVMVYEGKKPILLNRSLDPHFTPLRNSPIARFRPDAKGLKMALAFASAL